jgi:hypothetical protein
MTRQLIALAALLAALVPSSGHAQPRGARPDWAQDRGELGRDRREGRDDLRDLRRVEQLLADYDLAARARNRRALRQLEETALRMVRQEWIEGERELAADRGELARSRQEARHGDLDDRRDLRDDRRDAVAEARSQERLRQIGEGLWSLRGRFRPGEVARKRELIEAMVRLARSELRGDREERREDRREYREDHREDHREHR